MNLDEAKAAMAARNEELENQLKELRAKKAEVEKAEALVKAPLETRGEKHTMNNEEILNALQEKRAVTLNGTGAIAQVKDVIKAIMEKDEILSKVRYEYGPNAQTNIPVWTDISDPTIVAENGTITADSTGGIANVTITPKTWAALLQVSYEAIKLGSVNLEAEMNDIFARAFTKVLRKQVVNGTGTSGECTGFTVATGATEVELAGASVKMADIVNLAMNVRGKDAKYSIFMSPTDAAAVLSDTSANAFVYIEELARNGSVAGVEVIVTDLMVGKKPHAVPLARYAVGMAAEMEIKEKEAYNNTGSYFQGLMAFGGKPVVNAEIYKLIDKAD